MNSAVTRSNQQCCQLCQLSSDQIPIFAGEIREILEIQRTPPPLFPQLHHFRLFFLWAPQTCGRRPPSGGTNGGRPIGAQRSDRSLAAG